MPAFTTVHVLHKIPIMQIKSLNLPRKIVMMHSLTLRGQYGSILGGYSLESNWKLERKREHINDIVLVKSHPRNKNPAGSLMSMQDLEG